jgi:hypothetical protein
MPSAGKSIAAAWIVSFVVAALALGCGEVWYEPEPVEVSGAHDMAPRPWRARDLRRLTITEDAGAACQPVSPARRGCDADGVDWSR